MVSNATAVGAKPAYARPRLTVGRDGPAARALGPPEGLALGGVVHNR